MLELETVDETASKLLPSVSPANVILYDDGFPMKLKLCPAINAETGVRLYAIIVCSALTFVPDVEFVQPKSTSQPGFVVAFHAPPFDIG